MDARPLPACRPQSLGQNTAEPAGDGLKASKIGVDDALCHAVRAAGAGTQPSPQRGELLPTAHDHGRHGRQLRTAVPMSGGHVLQSGEPAVHHGLSLLMTLFSASICFSGVNR